MSLLRHLPPENTEANLKLLVKAVPELEADLRNAVDVPCRVVVCPTTSREFLACDYNRVEDAYRSPWSGDLVALEGEKVGSDQLPERLAKIETLANKAFDSYRQLYYEGGISSVYLWPGYNEGSFGAAVLIKKDIQEESGLDAAGWDAIHVFEVEPVDSSSFLLSQTSTILLSIKADFEGIDKFTLGGSLTRQNQTKITGKSEADLVAGMGRLLEETEGRMRSNLQEIYFGKTLEIVNGLHPSVLPEGYLRNQNDFRAEMKQRLSSQQ